MSALRGVSEGIDKLFFSGGKVLGPALSGVEKDRDSGDVGERAGVEGAVEKRKTSCATSSIYVFQLKKSNANMTMGQCTIFRFLNEVH